MTSERTVEAWMLDDVLGACGKLGALLSGPPSIGLARRSARGTAGAEPRVR